IVSCFWGNTVSVSFDTRVPPATPGRRSRGYARLTRRPADRRLVSRTAEHRSAGAVQVTRRRKKEDRVYSVNVLHAVHYMHDVSGYGRNRRNYICSFAIGRRAAALVDAKRNAHARRTWCVRFADEKSRTASARRRRSRAALECPR